MHGLHVSVIEKRAEFSRANVLILWQCTLDDLVALGAKHYVPSLQTAATWHHMGTREIQLSLLKTALLFGVRCGEAVEEGAAAAAPKI